MRRGATGYPGRVAAKGAQGALAREADLASRVNPAVAMG